MMHELIKPTNFHYILNLNLNHWLLIVFCFIAGSVSQVFGEASATTSAAKAKGPVSIKDVCTKLRQSGPNGFLWKPASDHSGYPREGKPTALWTKDIPTKSCLSLYAVNGVKIGQIGVFEYSGKYGGRWYSGYGCGDRKSASQVAKAAKQAAGRKKIYVEGRGGTCHGPFHPEEREGSISY